MRDSTPTLNLLCLNLFNGKRIYVARDQVAAFGVIPPPSDETTQPPFPGANSVITVIGVGDLPVTESVNDILSMLSPTVTTHAPFTIEPEPSEPEPLPVESL